MFTFVKEEKLDKTSEGEDISSSKTSQFLKNLAHLGAHKPKTVVLAGVALFVIAIFGISKTVVNNNMVDWFKEKSDIRVADSVMNGALGGTSLGYIVATSQEENFIKTPEAMRYIDGLQRHIEKLSVVGKTTSVVDYVKRINRVLHDDDPQYDSIPGFKGGNRAVSVSVQHVRKACRSGQCNRLSGCEGKYMAAAQDMGRSGNARCHCRSQ